MTRNPAVIGGDQSSVVFSESLQGGSSDEWVTGLWELRVRFHDAPFLEFNRVRYRPAYR